MKKGIHPEYKVTSVECISCGNVFETHSITDKFKVNVCYKCHPFYTGKAFGSMKTGRIDKFEKRANQKISKN